MDQTIHNIIVQKDDGEVMTAKQTKELQKRLAQLAGRKKSIAIFTPHSDND